MKFQRKIIYKKYLKLKKKTLSQKKVLKLKKPTSQLKQQYRFF